MPPRALSPSRVREHEIPRPSPGAGNFTAMSLHLRPSSLIVFEGLDRSGKSTQIKRLSALDWAPPGPRFTHLPSGMTDLTSSIYSLTEDGQMSSPLAQRLRVVACQACIMWAF